MRNMRCWWIHILVYVLSCLCSIFFNRYYQYIFSHNKETLPSILLNLKKKQFAHKWTNIQGASGWYVAPYTARITSHKAWNTSVDILFGVSEWLSLMAFSILMFSKKAWYHRSTMVFQIFSNSNVSCQQSFQANEKNKSKHYWSFVKVSTAGFYSRTSYD